MWRDGSLLVVRKGEEFPDRCVKTNRPAHGRRVQQAAETGFSATLVAHMYNPIAGGLLGHLFTKRVEFSVGLCDEWCGKRRRAFCLAGGIVLVSLAVTACAVAMDAFLQGGDGRELVAHGVPPWLLVLFGLAAVAGGLFLWNGLGPRFGLGPAGGRVDRRVAVGTLVAWMVLAILEVGLSHWFPPE